jgi:hypothetical protein
MRSYVLTGLGVVAGLVLGTTVFGSTIASAAQTVGATIIGPLDGGGNVRVHEQGTVPASQSGNWHVSVDGTPHVSIDGTPHVSVDGTPQVTSSDTSTLLGSFVGAPAGGGAFTEAVDADISQVRTVRVMTNCFAGSDCANILVRVYSIVGSRSYLLDQFGMQNFLSATRTYDVPGGLLAVQLLNNNAAAVSNIGVAVYGRAN